MTTLQRRALARLPLTAAEVEAFYATEFGHRRPVRDILESHERLRAELRGSAELHAESAAALRGAAAEVARLRAALARLEGAADPFLTDQTGAVDQRCGLTQPVTVAECEELTAAVEAAREALAGETT